MAQQLKSGGWVHVIDDDASNLFVLAQALQGQYRVLAAKAHRRAWRWRAGLTHQTEASSDGSGTRTGSPAGRAGAEIPLAASLMADVAARKGIVARRERSL